MLKSVVVGVVDFCAQRRWWVLIVGISLAVAALAYDVTRFAITTDTDNLISDKLPWRQRQAALSEAFPDKGILVVVSAPTPENAEAATSALTQELAKHPDLFRAVVQPDGGEFFQRNGLLFQPLASVKKSITGLSSADFLISSLAADPTLRGVAKALGRRRTNCVTSSKWSRSWISPRCSRGARRRTASGVRPPI
jgi:uncharacterized protein